MVSKNGKRRNMDGLFIDWAGNFKDSSCPGQTMKVHLKTFQMLQKYQMWPVFSLSGSTAEAAQLWEAGVGYTQFTEYWTPSDAGIWDLYNLTEVFGVRDNSVPLPPPPRPLRFFVFVLVDSDTLLSDGPPPRTL